MSLPTDFTENLRLMKNLRVLGGNQTGIGMRGQEKRKTSETLMKILIKSVIEIRMMMMMMKEIQKHIMIHMKG